MGATTTTFQIGSYAPLTDSFSLTLDLNDRATYFLQSVDLPQPDKVWVKSFNVRTPGEAVQRVQYKNRLITATLYIQAASTTAILSAVHNLLAAVENPPYTVKIQLAGGSLFTHFTCVAVHSVIPYSALRYLQGIAIPITLVLECLPTGFTIPRQTAQNLASNPGFEQSFGGGTAQTAPLAFSDPLANFNAYSIQAGGALAQDTFRYTDAVQSDGPRRYLRFGEPSGTVAFEVEGGNNGTITGGVTLGVAGAIVGSADTAYTFNGSTGKVSVPTALMPTGNQAISMECWFKFAANPASAQVVMGYGDTAHTSKAFLEFQLQTTGAVIFNCGANNVSSAAGIATGVYHHLLGTYDGTTMTFYVDGASVGTPQTPAGGLVIPASPTLLIGCGLASSAFFNGQVDEVAFYGSALSSARASAHFTTGHNAPVATGNTMVIPAAGRVSFGSPVWSAMQTWQVRFRYLTGGTYSFYIHYTDASNNLQVQVTSTTIALIHTVAGVAHTLVTSAAFSITLQTEVLYWVTFTQFPTVTGNPPYLTAALFVDSGGAMASQYASVSAAAFDAVTAESGAPQMAASGAALGIGGAFSNVHAVFLFGPGGWLRQDSGTGTSAGAWDQNTSNTFPNGPVTSFGAARIDCAPAGTVNASWTNYSGGTPAGSNAIPVSAAGNVLGVSAYVHSTGLGVAAAQKLSVREYDASGNLLRTDTGWTAPSLTSNQAWPAAGVGPNLSGTYTTGASCAYVGVSVVVADTNAGASAGAIVWFDNVQVYNQTTTGMSSMPYHEMRFPNSPAQLMVSGLQGDAIAPCWLGVGFFVPSAPSGVQEVSVAVGRRQLVGASAQLVQSNVAVANGQTAALDAASFGGFIIKQAASTSALSEMGWGALYLTNDTRGLFRAFLRAQTAEAAGNLSKVSAQAVTVPIVPGGSLTISQVANTAVTPFPASNEWAGVDLGLVSIPVVPLGALSDATQFNTNFFPNFLDTASAAVISAGHLWLLPVDGGQVSGTFNSFGILLGGAYQWVYFDGLSAATQAGASAPRGGASAVTFGVQGLATQTALPSPANAIAGTGTFSSSANFQSFNPLSGAYMTLDPTVTTPGGGGFGVNQLVASVVSSHDTNGAIGGVLPSVLTEMVYQPQYLFPR